MKDTYIFIFFFGYFIRIEGFLLFNRKGMILKLDVENAVRVLYEKNYGLHLMMIYSDLKVLRKFYSMFVKKEIESHNGIVVIAPFYETTDSVRSVLANGPTAIDIAKCERDNSVTIIDATRFYSTKESPVDFMSMIAKCAKSMGKSGVSIMGDMGAFYFKGNSKDLVDYEVSFLPKKYSIDRKGFCLYNQKDLDSLSGQQQLELYEKHGMIIQLLD